MSSFRFLFPTESCEDAIRNWVEVKIGKQMPLQGGVSGASVYRIDAEIEFPGLQSELQPKLLQFVIKYSTKQGFQQEEKLFENSPDELKRWFVNFAAPKIPVDGNFFMIMPYLRDHETLAFIVYHKGRAETEESMKKVWEALQSIHFYKEKDRDPYEKKPADLGKLFRMYLGDMQKSLQKITRIAEILPNINSQPFTANHERIHPPSFYNEKILQIAKEVSPSFSNWTHGDCHARNILIKQENMDLKFIDIDKMQRDGDYIYDLGSLIADIDIYNSALQSRRPNFELKKKSKRSFLYVLPTNPNAAEASKLLLDKIRNLANKIGDKGWRKRLYLAEARYLLSMVPKTIDREKAFVVYCEGMKALGHACILLEKKRQQ